jgi:YHS domain-containing protein
MRLLLTGSILLALAACSTDRRLLAPDSQADGILTPEKKNPGNQLVYDPVCGASMGRDDAPLHMMYHGTLFYFDREECKHQFEGNPAAYSFVY